MTDRDKPCDQRIDTALQRIEAEYADLYRKLDDPAEREDGESEDLLWEQLGPLSMDTKRVMRIMFSWGGPSDWIDAELTTVDHRQEVTSLVYHYADWFDHAEREIAKSAAPALWRLAEQYGRYPAAYES